MPFFLKQFLRHFDVNAGSSANANGNNSKPSVLSICTTSSTMTKAKCISPRFEKQAGSAWSEMRMGSSMDSNILRTMTNQLSPKPSELPIGKRVSPPSKIDSTRAGYPMSTKQSSPSSVLPMDSTTSRKRSKRFSLLSVLPIGSTTSSPEPKSTATNSGGSCQRAEDLGTEPFLQRHH